MTEIIKKQPLNFNFTLNVLYESQGIVKATVQLENKSNDNYFVYKIPAFRGVPDYHFKITGPSKIVCFYHSTIYSAEYIELLPFSSIKKDVYLSKICDFDVEPGFYKVNFFDTILVHEGNQENYDEIDLVADTIFHID